MITLAIKNKQDQVIVGRIDHEKEPAPFQVSGDDLAVLAIKNYPYEEGDKIVVEVTGENPYYVLQLDETLAPSLIYLSQSTWEYQIPWTESH